MTSMKRVRRQFVCLLAVLLPAIGCGQPAPPPPGAPPDAAAPAIDLGTPSGAEDTGAGTTNSTPESGTPAAEQGEKK